ncbi:MAG: hypothetical protein E7208_02630 [Clostridium butyricum]|nr:hypothetical protein [Clostridium butyricum]
MIKKQIINFIALLGLIVIYSPFSDLKVNADTVYSTPYSVATSSVQVENGDYNIISASDVTIEQAKQWAQSKGASQTFISLADLYFKYSGECGQVNPAIAYVQAAKETKFGKFGGVIDESYKNPCGLKITAGGDNYDPKAHQKFSSWDDGVKAHLDHLALYAGANGYPKSNTSDPRHFSTIKGKAVTVKALGGKWAPSQTYGDEVNKYYNELISVSGNKNMATAPILKKTIVIDPGHNYGGDKGATATIDGETYSEVELNMEVSLYLKNELESKGYNVLLTREADEKTEIEVTESLKNRVIIANNANASLFISIHHNTAEAEEANGIETYYSSAEQGDDFKGGAVANKLELSKKIALSVNNKVADGMGLNNRGVKDSELFIKSTNMPSILIEAGFITNEEEAERCSDSSKQEELAKLIAEAVSENL